MSPPPREPHDGPDARLRDLARRARETGAPEDGAAWLLERVRTGDLGRENLRLAAHLGDPAATAALDDRAPVREPGELRAWAAALEHWGPDVLARASVAAAETILGARSPASVRAAIEAARAFVDQPTEARRWVARGAATHFDRVSSQIPSIAAECARDAALAASHSEWGKRPNEPGVTAIVSAAAFHHAAAHGNEDSFTAIFVDAVDLDAVAEPVIAAIREELLAWVLETAGPLSAHDHLARRPRTRRHVRRFVPRAPGEAARAAIDAAAEATASSPGVETGRRLLRLRLDAGVLDPVLVELAAFLGDPASAAALRDDPPRPAGHLRDLVAGLPTWGRAAGVRAASAAAHALVSYWDAARAERSPDEPARADPVRGTLDALDRWVLAADVDAELPPVSEPATPADIDRRARAAGELARVGWSLTRDPRDRPIAEELARIDRIARRVGAREPIRSAIAGELIAWATGPEPDPARARVAARRARS